MAKNQPIRFAFLVHPLVDWHRRILGVRQLHLPLALGSENVGMEAVGLIGRIRIPTLEGYESGAIISLPDTAHRLAQDQARAAAHQLRAGEIAHEMGAAAVGLGNALGVVAGRGTHLAENLPIPVSTGHSSTAWTCARITLLAQERHALQSQPIGILGFKGTVGDAVAQALREAGQQVWVDATGKAAVRRAEKLGCQIAPREQLVARCRLIIGTTTTGPAISGHLLTNEHILIDLALPPTLEPGTHPRGLRIYAGETLRLPGTVRANVWGWIWLALAQYGKGCIYACLAEPVLGAKYGADACHLGRRITLSQLAKTGERLQQLGFQPTLQRLS